MTKRMNTEERMEARFASICKADDKAYAKLCKRMDAAEHMIGELNSGKTYIWPAGGKYREGPRHELVDFLLRNNYV
jgi:hypothetical protein